MTRITVFKSLYRHSPKREVVESITVDEGIMESRESLSKLKNKATRLLKPHGIHKNEKMDGWVKARERYVRHYEFTSVWVEIEETPEVKPEPEFVNTVEGDTLKPDTAPETTATVKKAETLDEAVMNARAIKKTNPELAITAKVHGDWLWISGETFKVKNDFKASGFFWARKKQMWYWKPSSYKRRRFKGAREFSIDQIIAEHGETEVDITTNALANTSA